jgi:hypothetical protein
MHDAIIPEVGPIFVDVQFFVLLLDASRTSPCVQLMVPLAPPISRHMDLILLGVSDCETPQVFSPRIISKHLFVAVQSFLDYLNSALSHVSASQAAPMRDVRDKYLKYCALV